MSSATMPFARGTSALTDAELAPLRNLLELQRTFRCDQLDQLHADLLGERTEIDRAIKESLVTGARAALRDVLQALRRMDAGSYGTCGRCADRLPTERLEVLPQAALCMTCQREAELG
jgi:RNA polymerase-binding transcription factor DksA